MITLRELICKDLKYCCPYAFFCMFKKTALLAERLGVTPRAIRLHKSKWRNGEYVCEGQANCLKKKLGLKPPPRNQSR